jgi:hypothetical protein
MPPCPLGRCVNVTHASGALQFFASSTAAFEVPGSRVGRAALMSAGISTSSVDSSPRLAGLSPRSPGNTTMAAIPAIASPPAIPIHLPREEPGFLPPGGSLPGGRSCPLGAPGETSCCASGSRIFRYSSISGSRRPWSTADVTTNPDPRVRIEMRGTMSSALPHLVFVPDKQRAWIGFCHKATARNVRWVTHPVSRKRLRLKGAQRYRGVSSPVAGQAHT